MWYLRKYYWFRLQINVKYNNFLAYYFYNYWFNNSHKYMDLTAYWLDKLENTY